MRRDRAEEALARFRPWLYAAAIYNLLWGSLTILFPEALFRLLQLPLPSYLPSGKWWACSCWSTLPGMRGRRATPAGTGI